MERKGVFMTMFPSDPLGDLEVDVVCDWRHLTRTRRNMLHDNEGSDFQSGLVNAKSEITGYVRYESAE